jgi:ATP-dependent helicase/nuclease subunit A
MARPADHESRERIIHERAANLCVEAGAGTGKTTLLVARILSLVLDDTEPLRLSRTAAITFTEKAAGELKVKIRHEIEERLREASDASEQGKLRQALADLETAAIMTLHSFARLLITERPVEAGIDPQAAILDASEHDRRLAKEFDRWFDELVALPDPPEVLRWYLREKSYWRRRDENDWLWKVVRKVAADADVLLDATMPPPKEELFAAKVDEWVARYSATRDWALATCHNPNDTAVKRWVEFVDALVALKSAGAWNVAMDAVEALKPPTSSAGAPKNWDEKDLEEAQKRAGGVNKKMIRDELKRGGADEQVRALFDLARGFVRRFGDTKQRRGELGFQDLLVTARDMLQGSREARTYFQERFDAVLIDEFQDTDPLQAEIALFLCEQGAEAARHEDVNLTPGKLMIVGDPKQSIYRFRRADIEIYRDTMDLLAARGAIEETIGVNFRCAKPIIDTVNALFAPLMIRDPALPTSPDYEPLKLGRSETPPEAGVRILLPNDEQAAGLTKAAQVRAAEFGAVARWLAEAHAAGLPVWDKQAGALRPMAWKDVAILDRRSTEFGDLETALRQFDVPYRTDGGKVFFKREEIAAAIQGLAAIEDPDNSIALAQWLGSDLVGRRDEELVRHVLTRETKRLSYLGEIEADDPLAGPLATLRNLHENRDKVGCLATVRGLFAAFDSRAIARTLPRGEVAVANLHKVLEAARAADRGGRSFGEFAREWADALAEGREEGDFAITEDADDVVRLMTIHKAKGLDWPIVIVAELGAESKKHTEDIVFRRSSGEVAVRLAAGQEMFNHAERAEDEGRFAEAERVRLMYVALTRARDYLVLPIFTNAARESYNKAAKELLAPQPGETWRAKCNALVAHGARIEDQDLAALTIDLARSWRTPLDFGDGTITPGLQKTIDALLAQTAEAADTPAVDRGVSFLSPSASRERLPRPGRKSYGRAMGLAFHALMERADLADPGRDEAALGQVRAEFNLTDGQADDLRRWAKNLAKMDCYQPIGAGRVWREAPFTWTDTGTGENFAGKIDLLAETDDGLLILDYKTDGILPEEMPAFTDHYRRQGEIYRDAIAALTGSPTIMVLCFVDLGAAVEV